MSRFILHHNGAYNMWTTVADGPCYGEALTLAELRSVETVTDERLARAHATGCSGIGQNLTGCVSCNTEGPGGAELPLAEFIAQFLTLPKPQEVEP